MYIPTAKGYFSGCGGLEIGMMRAGVKIIQSLDIDADSVQTMKMNPQYFGHSVLCQDIKDTTVLEQEKSDVILGTYPCTRYSTIADIHGTRTGDDLFLHFFRHIAIEQPEMYVVENVPGMRIFPVVMEAMSKLPGYNVKIFCPLNANKWLPQDRKRLILIGTKRPFNISEPPAAIKRPTIKDILEPDAEIVLSKSAITRLKGGYRDLPIIVDPADKNAIAPCCVAHYAKDMGTRLVKDSRSKKYGVRSFTVREYARLQGFPDDFKFQNKRSAFQQIGNAVPVDMGEWAGREIMKYFGNKFATVYN